MSASNVIPFRPVRTLTSRERLEALVLAEMHEERAAACMAEQAALRAMLIKTAEFLRSIAR
jgi:hypothetical protein